MRRIGDAKAASHGVVRTYCAVERFDSSGANYSPAWCLDFVSVARGHGRPGDRTRLARSRQPTREIKP
jgi:hypothetical protein